MVTGKSVENVSLGEAASRYLGILPDEKKNAAQQEINNFIRWYGGREKFFAGLEGSAVGNYAERLSQTDAACAQKLELIRGFLAHAYKQQWCQENLSVSIRIVKKSKPKVGAAKKKNQKKEPSYMSQKAFDEIEVELKTLREKRLAVTEDIRRAAADKDFKENAPYHAAREQKGMIDGKILELEGMLSSAAIIDENRVVTHTVTIGDTVILEDSTSCKEFRYTLVGQREVNPTKGKISAISPVGKSVIGKSAGDSIEVKVPSGKLCFLLKAIEH
ncbi:MAG: transcription elongation factor GreA [Dehalococcoidales bacterium]|nr:transcription elongation factor GreA [Dehalococcoidales bacterium]